MKKGSKTNEDLGLESKLNHRFLLPTRLARNGTLLGIIFVVGFLSVVLQGNYIQSHVSKGGTNNLVFGNFQDEVIESVTMPLIQRKPGHKSTTDALDGNHPATQVNEGMAQLVHIADDSTPNATTNFTEIVQRHQLATVFKTNFSLSNNNCFPWCTEGCGNCPISAIDWQLVAVALFCKI
jgi:hypothetical protein